MPAAFVCSRCDDVFRGYPSLSFKWNRVAQGATLPVDDDVELCPQCREQFCETMNELWENHD